MEFGAWTSYVDPKVAASWDLHAEQPASNAFYIIKSSIMGIKGTAARAGYYAGITTQDALAGYRVAEGELAVALDLGAVPDDGYLVEHSDFLRGLERTDKYVLFFFCVFCVL